VGGAISWRVAEEAGGTRVVFSGDLNEHAELDALRIRLSGRVIFDLGGVSRINSAGVHQWISFVRGLVAATELTFTHCTPAFINQLNVLYGFGGSGRVVSFYAPYVCAHCDQERLELVEADELRGAGVDLPEIACPRCGVAMELDEDRERYLAFLDHS